MNERIPHVLVVDDDLRLRDLMERFLGEQGFKVGGVANTRAMDQYLAAHAVDAIVLDLMLPGEDGLSACRRLRAAGTEIPVVMLTARGDEIDRIVGLEIGADDYLPKPCNPRELVARLRAVLRRVRCAVPGVPQPGLEPVGFGPFVLDPAARELTRDGQRLRLTTGEFAVLFALVSHPHQPMSREKLVETARGRGHEAFDRSMDVMVSRLRRLIEPDPRNPRYLQTVWGVGYVFVPDGAPR